MSFHAIHTEYRDAVCGWDAATDNYFLQILDKEKNHHLFTSENFESHLTVDEILFALTEFNVPIPRGLRAQLVTDGVLKDANTIIHYHFDKGLETHRHYPEKTS